MKFKNIILLCSLILVASVVGAQKDPYGLDGKVFVLTNVQNGKVLDGDTNTMGKNGTIVHSYYKGGNGNPNQQWVFVATDDCDKCFYIGNVDPNAGQYNFLEVSSHDIGKDNGKVQLWEFNGGSSGAYGANQVWNVHQQGNGQFSITSQASGAYALSVNKDQLDQDGGSIVTYYNKGGIPYMYWNLEEVSSGESSAGATEIVQANFEEGTESYGLEWLPYRGSMPEGVVYGGQENGKELAVCACEYAGGAFSGKVVNGKCHIGYGEGEVIVPEFYVFVNHGGYDLNWVPTSGATMPEGAVMGGLEEGQPIYVGRIVDPNQGARPGSVLMYEGKYVALAIYDGQPVANYEFELLVATERNECLDHPHRFPSHVKYSDFMKRGHRLDEGDNLTSPNLRYELRLMDDGRLVLEEVLERMLCEDEMMVVESREIWSNNTAGDPNLNYYLTFQENDGNFCIYSEENGFVWCSMSNDRGAMQVDISNTGHLEIVNADGKEIWSIN